MDIFEKWRSGEELSVAYFDFTGNRQRAHFRQASNPGALEAAKLGLLMDLFDHVIAGRLEAYGFRIAPTPSDGPIQIPIHCFMQRPNTAECDRDEIIASGVTYERVRVTVRSQAKGPKEPPAHIVPPSPYRQGRPSTYAAAREVLAMLHKVNPSSIHKPAARLIDDFNKEYPSIAQSHGLQPAPLSARKLQDHLKAFRQELAETGKNKTSN